MSFGTKRSHVQRGPASDGPSARDTATRSTPGRSCDADTDEKPDADLVRRLNVAMVFVCDGIPLPDVAREHVEGPPAETMPKAA